MNHPHVIQPLCGHYYQFNPAKYIKAESHLVGQFCQVLRPAVGASDLWVVQFLGRHPLHLVATHELSIIQCNAGDGPATRLMPQSTDQGKTWIYVPCCVHHVQGWWDGADWDGHEQGLEINIYPDLPDDVKRNGLPEAATESEIEVQARARAAIQEKYGANPPQGVHRMAVSDLKPVSPLIRKIDSIPVERPFTVLTKSSGNIQVFKLKDNAVEDGCLEAILYKHSDPLIHRVLLLEISEIKGVITDEAKPKVKE